MKQGFDQVDKRFGDSNRRFTGIMWLIGTALVEAIHTSVSVWGHRAFSMLRGRRKA